MDINADGRDELILVAGDTTRSAIRVFRYHERCLEPAETIEVPDQIRDLVAGRLTGVNSTAHLVAVGLTNLFVISAQNASDMVPTSTEISPLVRSVDAIVSLSSSLTYRETEVAALTARGLSAKEVSRRLGISKRTVESHLANIYGKLRVRTKHDLIARIGSLSIGSH